MKPRFWIAATAVAGLLLLGGQPATAQTSHNRWPTAIGGVYPSWNPLFTVNGYIGGYYPPTNSLPAITGHIGGVYPPTNPLPAIIGHIGGIQPIVRPTVVVPTGGYIRPLPYVFPNTARAVFWPYGYW